MPIEVNGKSFETDEEGYLANLSEWEKDLATAMAKEDGIDLGDDHWEIINFLREYYEEYQFTFREINNGREIKGEKVSALIFLENEYFLEDFIIE